MLLSIHFARTFSRVQVNAARILAATQANAPSSNTSPISRQLSSSSISYSNNKSNSSNFDPDSLSFSLSNSNSNNPNNSRVQKYQSQNTSSVGFNGAASSNSNNANAQNLSIIVHNLQSCPDIWKAAECLESLEPRPSRGAKSGQFLSDHELELVVNRLFELVKLEKSETTKKQILHSLGFQKFSQILRLHSRWLSSSSLITSTKLFVYLGCPTSNPTLQIILRLLSKLTNQFSCQEVIYLSFLLSKLQGFKNYRVDSNPGANSGAGGGTGDSLIAALQLALPIVFETKILQNEGTAWKSSIINEPNLLTDCLTFTIKFTSGNPLVLERILGWINQSNLSNFTPKHSLNILWSLLDSNSKFLNAIEATAPGIDKLVSNCLHKINSNVWEFTTDELSTVATKFARKFPHIKSIAHYAQRGGSGGNKNDGGVVFEGLDDFLELYCQRLVEPRQTEGHVLYSMKLLSILRHLNIEFLDHGARTILQNPGYFLDNDAIFYGTIRCYSNFNYKPPGWEQLKGIFLNHPVLTKDLVLQSIPFIVDLLALDIFPRDFINKLFSVQFHSKLVQYSEKYSPSSLILIHNKLKSLNDEYDGPWPPASMVESWEQTVRKIPKIYELKDSLVAGIGGGSYVLSGLYINGLHIDHAVVMRKGGYPVALDSSLTQEPGIFYSDLVHFLPPESELILIKAFFEESYANNTPRLRGISALELSLIENTGHPVVSISVPKWKELGHHERIPWLMEKIREKQSSSSTN